MADETNALNNPEQSLAEYRAARDGKPLPEKTVTSDAAPVDKPEVAESAAAPESAEDTNEEQPETTEQPKSKPKRGLVSEVISLRTKARELEARLAAATSRPEPPPADTRAAQPSAPPVAPGGDPEPEPEKYADYVEWQKSWSRWDRRQAQREEAQNAARERVMVESRTREQTWAERLESAQADHEDFVTVALNVDLPVSLLAGDAIKDAPNGPQILYYLGQNPEEAKRINKLSPHAQVREIGKIELRLTPAEADADAEVPPHHTPPVVSKAPTPAPRLTGGSLSKPNPVRNLEGMTNAEYRAYREAGKIR